MFLASFTLKWLIAYRNLILLLHILNLMLKVNKIYFNISIIENSLYINNSKGTIQNTSTFTQNVINCITQIIELNPKSQR
jgi:hypothetical protein